MWISKKDYNQLLDRAKAGDTGVFSRLANSLKASTDLSIARRDGEKYRKAILQVIEAFAPNYEDDVDKFVADMAIWKDSVERERALLRLNGLDTESLTKMFNAEGDGDDDAD
jgi:ABC-type taurine transport system substrate-binding protein